MTLFILDSTKLTTNVKNEKGDLSTLVDQTILTLLSLSLKPNVHANKAIFLTAFISILTTIK